MRSRRGSCAPARSRALLGETLAATHLSAAWIHGALDEPPARHTVQRAVPRRLHHVIGPPAALPRPARRSRRRPGGDRRRAASPLRRARSPICPASATTSHARAARRSMADAAPGSGRATRSRGSRRTAPCRTSARRSLLRALAARRRRRSGGRDAVDVVDGVDAPHGVEHPLEVDDVAHLEHEAAEREPVVASSTRSRRGC